METRIGQHDHLFFELSDQGLEVDILDIGRGTVPLGNEAPLVQDQTQFASHDPTVVGQPLFADLSDTVTFADGMDQLDPIGIGHPRMVGGPQKCLAHP